MGGGRGEGGREGRGRRVESESGTLVFSVKTRSDCCGTAPHSGRCDSSLGASGSTASGYLSCVVLLGWAPASSTHGLGCWGTWVVLLGWVVGWGFWALAVGTLAPGLSAPRSSGTFCFGGFCFSMFRFGAFCFGGFVSARFVWGVFFWRVRQRGPVLGPWVREARHRAERAAAARAEGVEPDWEGAEPSVLRGGAAQGSGAWGLVLERRAGVWSLGARPRAVCGCALAGVRECAGVNVRV